MRSIIDKNNNYYDLRTILPGDYNRLGIYFESLSEETKKRFGPHPLTAAHAKILCNLENDTAERYILLNKKTSEIAGYFILEYKMSIHEAGRYEKQGIKLHSGEDILFAPSILDKYQNTGLSSLVMPHLIKTAKEKNIKRIILMGGTQETNSRAIRFYEKFNFKKYGGYSTDQYNYDMMLEL